MGVLLPDEIDRIVKAVDAGLRPYVEEQARLAVEARLAQIEAGAAAKERAKVGKASPSLIEVVDPEGLAEMFHEAYERLAPELGYETRANSAVPWSEVPEPNRSLMLAAAADVLQRLRARPVFGTTRPR